MNDMANFELNPGEFDTKTTNFEVETLGALIKEVVDIESMGVFGEIASEITGERFIAKEQKILEEFDTDLSVKRLRSCVGGEADIERLITSLEESELINTGENQTQELSVPGTVEAAEVVKDQAHGQNIQCVPQAPPSQNVPKKLIGDRCIGYEHFGNVHDSTKEVMDSVGTFRAFIEEGFLDQRPLQHIDAGTLNTYLTVYLTSMFHRVNAKQEYRRISKFLETKKYPYLLVESAHFTTAREKVSQQLLKSKPVKVYTSSELKGYALDQRSKNTVRKIDGSVRKIQQFISDNFEDSRKLEELPAVDLDHYMGNFFLNAKKPNDEEYEPDTLSSYFRCVHKHLEEVEYPYNIMVDDAFNTSRQVLFGKRKNLKSVGKGSLPNRAEYMEDEVIDALWDQEILGDKTPKSLQRAIFFHVTKGFGLRGAHESRQMCFGDITLQEPRENCGYLEWTERLSKTRRGEVGGHIRKFRPKIFALPPDTPERCPVRLYKLFISKRPLEMCHPNSPFFLAIRQNVSDSDPVWYTKGPLGKNTLGSMVADATKEAGYKDRKFTNHSLRRTVCQNLVDSHVQGTDIIQLTGHKNLQSLNSYTVSSESTQRDMSAIATTGKRSADTQAVCLPETQKRPRLPMQASQGACMSHPNPGAMSGSGFTPESVISGMFAGATINAPINLNIHVASNSAVQMSPKLPMTTEKEEE